MLTPDDINKLKQLGEQAALTGAPSFHDISGINHSDEARVEYEKAYRSTLAELEREGH